MNLPPFLQNPVYVLSGAAVAGLIGVIIAALPPDGSGAVAKEIQPAVRMEAPDADKLNERIPDTGAVLEKHLFVPGREATGQNSFPDLIVKGVFIGEQSSVILSLKSKPQTNLRVWLGEVEATLNSITDPRDPRQSLVTFLREWPIKGISQDSLTVEHFITGEVETYEVDYVAAKKVADDAQRGYGQGVMPQEKVASANAAQNGNRRAEKKAGAGQNANAGGGGMQFLPPMMQNMPPDQRMQIFQRIMQAGGTQNSSRQNSSTRNSSGQKKTGGTKR